jgi:hypothetical protein
MATLINISGGQSWYHTQASVDFPSVTSKTSDVASVTITGAQVGDIVFVTPTTAATTGLIFEHNPVIVATADTVVLRATNASAGDINQAAQVFNFLVLRPNVAL